MDIEKDIIGWLGHRLSLPVYAAVPKDRHGVLAEYGGFITVERTGGARDNVVIDRPTVAVQAWSTSRARAATLAYRVDDAMQGFASVPGIVRVSRNSLYNFPDLTGDSFTDRYQIVFDITTI